MTITLQRVTTFLQVWWLVGLNRLAQAITRRQSPAATGNTSSNLGWLAVVIFLIIAAYLFWTQGPGHVWFSSVLQAPTSISP